MLRNVPYMSVQQCKPSSFPGWSWLQFLVACSMQRWGTFPQRFCILQMRLHLVNYYDIVIILLHPPPTPPSPPLPRAPTISIRPNNSWYSVKTGHTRYATRSTSLVSFPYPQQDPQNRTESPGTNILIALKPFPSLPPLSWFSTLPHRPTAEPKPRGHKWRSHWMRWEKSYKLKGLYSVVKEIKCPWTNSHLHMYADLALAERNRDLEPVHIYTCTLL